MIPRFWKALGGGVVLSFLFFLLVSFGLFGDLPDIKELENPSSALSSEIYSEDGEVLGKYFMENRTNVRHEEIAQSVYDCLIATEDIRFEKHSGIDVRGTARALAMLGKDGGASTISQQLAKNLFSIYEKPKTKLGRVMQKCKEWIIAIRLERRYTKDEIITMYLNTVPFSGVSFGIEAASKEFFNKKPKDLKLEESAVLIGMLKANSAFNPKLNPDRSMKRRNIVLQQMKKYDKITEEEFLKLKETPIKLDYISAEGDGEALYFRDQLAEYLKDWCKDNGYNLYRSGLKIYTTINSKMQHNAEMAVKKHMKEMQKVFNQGWGKQDPWRTLNWQVIPDFIENAIKRTDRYKELQEKFGPDQKRILAELKKPVKMTVFSWNGERDTFMSPYDSMKYIKKLLHAGFVAVEPETGFIKAWVGGINHKYFKFDHVNKYSRRQVGSTFKPLVYATAMDINKIPPCQKFPREPVTFKIPGGTWTPRNDNGSGGEWTMAKGLALSDNYITAQVMKTLGDEGPQMVVKFAERVGIEKNRILPVPSICLGAVELSPYEMASAYTAFVNKGLWVEPTFITRIEDKKGNILAEFQATRHDQVLSEEKAYLMFKMLTGVVDFGTAGGLKGKYGLSGAYGGKTGTTQGSADGWFVGVTKNLVCATWVGADDPSVRIRNGWYGQGAMMALPIYGMFMQDCMKIKSLGLSTDWPDAPIRVSDILNACNEDGDNTNNGGEIDVSGLGD
ncbi:MAG: transglycosylase domain-containing protein [Bacteroidetes bacterium]|nr:transglycosylase domain-containing protein [Bacteroidota bacterium]